ncbi:MAG: hypothetical protein AAFO68_06985 [Pseudomonadota bacterium]
MTVTQAKTDAPSMQLAASIVEDLRAKLVYFAAPVPGLGTIGTVFENSNSNILH